MHSYSKDGNMGPGASNDGFEPSSDEEGLSPRNGTDNEGENDARFLLKPDGLVWDPQTGRYRRKTRER